MPHIQLSEEYWPFLERYLAYIVDNSQFSHLQGKAREQKIFELLAELEYYISERTLGALSPRDIATYSHLLQSNPNLPPEQAFEFLIQHIPNWDDLMEQIFKEFFQRYVK